MSWSAFFLVFSTVFLAELGDKTQLATMVFASQKEVTPWVVFLASALALVATSALGTLAGALLSKYIDPKMLQYGAGALFIILGILCFVKN